MYVTQNPFYTPLRNFFSIHKIKIPKYCPWVTLIASANLVKDLSFRAFCTHYLILFILCLTSFPRGLLVSCNTREHDFIQIFIFFHTVHFAMLTLTSTYSLQNNVFACKEITQCYPKEKIIENIKFCLERQCFT